MLEGTDRTSAMRRARLLSQYTTSEGSGADRFISGGLLDSPSEEQLPVLHCDVERGR